MLLNIVLGRISLLLTIVFLLSLFFTSTHLCFLISLKHAALEVICSNLVACYPAVVHLVEPLVRWLFNTIFVAILALLFGQIKSIFHLFVEWTPKWLLRSVVSSRSQMVLGQVGLRLKQSFVFFFCDRRILLSHFVERGHFLTDVAGASPEGIAVGQCVRCFAVLAVATWTASLRILSLADVHRVHVVRDFVAVERFHAVLASINMLGVLLGHLILPTPCGRVRVNHDVVVDVGGALAHRPHVHVLLVELLLEVFDVTSVLHVDEADWSHVLPRLFGGGVPALPHQNIVLLVSAHHASDRVALVFALSAGSGIRRANSVITLRGNDAPSDILQ